MYLGKESPKFFPAGPFFSVFQIKYLSKCPYFKKPPLPWKIPGYTPDKFLSFLINVFSFSLFIFFSLTELSNKNKQHVLEMFSLRLKVFFEVQVWKILIKLEYQFFLLQTWNFNRRATRGGRASPALFWKSKKVPWFWKKGTDCIHLCVKFSI